MVSERGLAVLRAIVEDYVASREPVGSKSIVDRHNFGVSAATVRNDMAMLEEEELIEAPHTSSGRIPTDKGYRVFVDQLAALRPLSAAQRHAIETFLGESDDLEELLTRTVRLVAQLTNQLAVVQYPNFAVSRIRHVELVSLAPNQVLCVVISDSGQVEQRTVTLTDSIDSNTLFRVRDQINELARGLLVTDVAAALENHESKRTDSSKSEDDVWQTISSAVAAHALSHRSERLVVAGAAHLIRTEQDFAGSIFSVIEAIEEQVILLKLFGEMVAENPGVAVSIGRENEPYGLIGTSVVSSTYHSPGRDAARLGVLGPTRMDYSNNMAAVRAVARYLTQTLGEH